MAMHCIPYPDGWKNLREMTFLAGHLILAAHILKKSKEITHSLRWGGNWDMDSDLDDQDWDDMGHYELI